MLPDNLFFHHRRPPPLSPKNTATTILPFPFPTRASVVYYMTDWVQEGIGGCRKQLPKLYCCFKNKTRVDIDSSFGPSEAQTFARHSLPSTMADERESLCKT